MSLRKGTSIYVEELVTSPNEKLLYITGTGIYLHSNFNVVASL